ncbi:hypothetical protein G9A89_017160 [Geosiphon pyriformis]|nr:hypothetical protein G9A89_017160 [Geosiphon pyriformis]
MNAKHRKKPFSGKQKRKQLQERRTKNVGRITDDLDESVDPLKTENLSSSSLTTTKQGGLTRNSDEESGKIVDALDPVDSRDHTKLYSIFKKLTPREVQKNRLASMKPLTRLPKSELEVSAQDMYPVIIEFPKRPPWNYKMTREQLVISEERYFQQWLKDLYERWGNEELSFFEHNIEVWRQLWRVFEISDIIFIIVDIRHPLLHFPPSLYNYVVKELKRSMVLVFNKIDLVAKKTRYAWSRYFEREFPGVHVVEFSCFPTNNKLEDDTSTAFLQKKARPPNHKYQRAVGIRDLLNACKEIKLVKQGLEVDWESLISQYSRAEDYSDVVEHSSSEDDHNEKAIDSGEESFEEDIEPDEAKIAQEDKLDELKLLKLDIEPSEMIPHKDYVTIGLVGHPNVGKSSLINGMLGRTVVSASKTPGHTKHFQTIHLTGNVRLCDSPGLVFPSLLPKPMQILSGMYSIAQVQEPYTTIQYLAERVPLEIILGLTPPETEKDYQWSAWDICEAYAIKRRFFTNRSSRPDVYRAANAILRLANDGRILLSTKPPGFFSNAEYLTISEDIDAESLKTKKLNAEKKPVTKNEYCYKDKSDGDTSDEEFTVIRDTPAQVGGSFGLLANYESEGE